MWTTQGKLKVQKVGFDLRQQDLRTVHSLCGTCGEASGSINDPAPKLHVGPECMTNTHMCKWMQCIDIELRQISATCLHGRVFPPRSPTLHLFGLLACDLNLSLGVFPSRSRNQTQHVAQNLFRLNFYSVMQNIRLRLMAME